MFAVSSPDLYILSDAELRALGSHPAFEEWINARCPNRLSDEERKDHDVYVSWGFRKGSLSEGYVAYLDRKESDYRECVDAVRWAQLGKTVAEHLARRQ